jgi:acyl-coenzyme A thioesterase PaaI-like protein
VSEPGSHEEVDPRTHVGQHFRLERWEIVPPPGDERPSDFGGRIPVDDHQRGPGGGLYTGALLTGIDSLGGFLSGLAVQPKWIVTTNMMVTVVQLDQQGPLRLHGRVLRRGRNAVVTALDIVDEGDGDRQVASATMTSAVLEPREMEISFQRPHVYPMPASDPDAPGLTEFFSIRPGTGPVTRLDLVERLRNPWGILHGGALAMLADVATCRAVEALPGRAGGRTGAVASGDTVLHYLSPARVGPIEARCQVLGGRPGRTLVRVAMHDLGAGDRMVSMGSVAVLDV